MGKAIDRQWRGTRNEFHRYATWKDEIMEYSLFAASVLKLARKDLKLISSIFKESSAWSACCGFCS
ncbi:MAG: hypothetical protein JWQ42_1593 [Edaphobacter sp.]|nr:hypothetical protein [Edaphobacter sp.]